MADEKAGGDAGGKADAKGNGKALNLGIPDSAGHKGTISIDANAPIESVVLAYKAVGKLADHIGFRVRDINKSNAPILFHNPADFVALAELRAFEKLADVFQETLTDLIARAKKLTGDDLFDPSRKNLEFFSLSAAAGVVGAIGGLISSGLQIMSLFRADNEFKNYKIEVEDQVLAITVAGRLAPYMPVFSSGIVPVEPAATSEALKTLKKLRDLRIELEGALALLGQSGNDNEGSASSHANAGAHGDADDGKRKDDKDPPSSDPLAEIAEELKKVGNRRLKDQKDEKASPASGLRAEIVKALKDFDAFVDSLSKVDEKTGASRLSQLLIGENLNAILAKGAYILWLKAVAAGGAAHAKTTTATSDLTYSGGAIASYAIFDSRGQLIEADTKPMYGGYVRVGDLPYVKIGLFGEPPDSQPPGGWLLPP
jgi:hypothetical protein